MVGDAGNDAGGPNGPYSSDAGDDWALSAPVVPPIHDRPETTARVVEAIAAVEPSVLYVADGPETGDSAEVIVPPTE